MKNTLNIHQILPFCILSLSTLTPAMGTIVKTTPHHPEIHLAQRLNCNNPQTQAEITQCSGLSAQKADKKLNQVYKNLMPKLPKFRQQKLIAAQQAWIKFRDRSCEFERSGFEGGSIAPSIYAGCVEQATLQRIEQLENYLKKDL